MESGLESFSLPRHGGRVIIPHDSVTLAKSFVDQFSFLCAALDDSGMKLTPEISEPFHQIQPDHVGDKYELPAFYVHQAYVHTCLLCRQVCVQHFVDVHKV